MTDGVGKVLPQQDRYLGARGGVEDGGVGQSVVDVVTYRGAGQDQVRVDDAEDGADLAGDLGEQTARLEG